MEPLPESQVLSANKLSFGVGRELGRLIMRAAVHLGPVIRSRLWPGTALVKEIAQVEGHVFRFDFRAKLQAVPHRVALIVVEPNRETGQKSSQGWLQRPKELIPPVARVLHRSVNPVQRNIAVVPLQQL